MRVTRKHHSIEYPYTLQDDILDDSENERDLGIWISNNLKWRKQVLEQCSKASKMLGLLNDQQEELRTIKHVGPCMSHLFGHKWVMLHNFGLRKQLTSSLA